MDERIVFSPSGPSSSEQIYSPHMWIKMITLKVQTCLGQRPNTRWGWEGASTTDHPMGKTNPFHQPSDPSWHKAYWTLAIRNTNLVPCVFCEKQGSMDKIQAFIIQRGVVCWPLFQGVITQECILKIVQHYIGESAIQNVSTVIPLLVECPQ
jgi:hypothetical protein